MAELKWMNDALEAESDGAAARQVPEAGGAQAAAAEGLGVKAEGPLAGDEGFQRQYALVLLQLKAVNKQLEAAVAHLRSRNKYQEVMASGAVSAASRDKVLEALAEGAGAPQGEGVVKVEGGEEGQEQELEPDLEAREAVEDSDEEEEDEDDEERGRKEGEERGAAADFDATLREKARAMISAAIKVRRGCQA